MKLRNGILRAPVGPRWHGTVIPSFLKWALKPESGSSTRVVRHAIKNGRLTRKGAFLLSSLSKIAGLKKDPFVPTLVGMEATYLVEDFP